MKKLSILLLCAVSTMVVSCTSPDKEGVRLANELTQAQISYQNARVNVYNTFIKTFDPTHYISRNSARESLAANISKAQKEYAAKTDVINNQYNQFLEKFANNDEKRQKFEEAYLATLDSATVPTTENEVELQGACEKLILKIVPPYPTTAQIAKDLVGRKFRETCADGYFPEYTWSVKESDVVDIEILECNDNKGKCSFKIAATISKPNAASWLADLKVDYVLGQGDGWSFHSLSCDQVKPDMTDTVNETVTHEILNTEEGTRMLIIRNNNSKKLVVGGATNNGADDNWPKFGVFVNPQDSVVIESTEARPIVECRIDFVEIG